METAQKELSLEERRANISRLIARWKEEKRISEEESRRFVQTPEFQIIKEKLRKKNAERGIIIPEI